VLGIIAHLYILKGELVEAESFIQAGKNDPHRESWPVFYAMTQLVEIELALARKDFSEAVYLAKEMVADLQQHGMRIYLAYVLYLQGCAFLGLGEKNKAWDCLTTARQEGEAIGSRRVLWRVYQVLREVESDPSEAQHLAQQTGEVVKYIIEHIDQTDLRQSFLNRPDVQAALI
jgi:hypothetical protein